MMDLDELLKLKAAARGRFYLEGNVLHAMSGRVAYIYPHNPYSEGNAAYIVAACNSLPELIAENRELRERVRELERERELCQELLHDSWYQTEQCIDLLHDAGVNLTKWACGVESCQGCDIPECDMGDLDMVEKYTSRKAMEQAAKEAGE